MVIIYAQKLLLQVQNLHRVEEPELLGLTLVARWHH